MEILRRSLGLDVKAYRLEPKLLEVHYGHWEGHLASELLRSDPEGVAGKNADVFGWRPRGGESYADLQDRISDWLQIVDRDTVAITHGGVSRVARGAVLGLDTSLVPTLEVSQDKVLVLRDGAMKWM